MESSSSPQGLLNALNTLLKTVVGCFCALKNHLYYPVHYCFFTFVQERAKQQLWSAVLYLDRPDYTFCDAAQAGSWSLFLNIRVHFRKGTHRNWSQAPVFFCFLAPKWAAWLRPESDEREAWEQSSIAPLVPKLWPAAQQDCSQRNSVGITTPGSHWEPAQTQSAGQSRVLGHASVPESWKSKPS